MFPQAVLHDEDTKYGDDRYPFTSYPPYVSGAGILMNWAAVELVNEQIPKTPIISIDDAFIGICARRAGMVKDKNIKAEFYK